MNKKQLVFLWLGIIAFILVTIQLLRPYTFFIADAAKGPVKIVWLILVCRWLVIAVVTGGLICTFQNKKDKKAKHEQKQ